MVKATLFSLAAIALASVGMTSAQAASGKVDLKNLTLVEEKGSITTAQVTENHHGGHHGHHGWGHHGGHHGHHGHHGWGHHGGHHGHHHNSRTASAEAMPAPQMKSQS